MGFFAMIASMLLGILFVAAGISRRKQKGWSITDMLLQKAQKALNY